VHKKQQKQNFSSLTSSTSSGRAFSRSSSSTSSSNQAVSSEQNCIKQQQQLVVPSYKVQTDLLPIPAFHQDMLPLLPGGQAYLDAAAAEHVASKDPEDFVMRCRSSAYNALLVLQQSLLQVSDQNHMGQAQASSQPMLSVAGVQLVLVLQLLAAGVLQRQQRQRERERQFSKHQLLRHSAQLLHMANAVLLRQIQASLEGSSSCLPEKLLQQAGLQLLQALAAPLQQLQLGSADDRFVVKVWRSECAVGCAAAGCAEGSCC
jgi:hypothetical protein